MQERFKCFNVNFRLLKTIYVHLLVCYLNYKMHGATIKILLLLLLLIAIGLSPGGSGYFTCIQNMKLVTNKFKSGGLHKKHVAAIWNLGNHLSICF